MMYQVEPVYFLLHSIFGDEPTGALNSKATEDVSSIFQDIHEEGQTILIVTHDAKVAVIRERVLYMKGGCIIDEIKLGNINNLNDKSKKI